MPIYEYVCEGCGGKREVSVPISGHTSEVSCDCGCVAKQTFSVNQMMLDIEPFLTEHITGNPVLVGSRRERRLLLEKYGLVEAG